MSAMGDKKLDKSKSKRRYQEASVRAADWREVNSELLKDCISTVTATGCAIRFGYSRDRGAFAIGIVGDGEPYTIWAGSIDELDIKMEKLMQSFHEPEK